MAKVEYKEFPQIGNGFRVFTQSIPPAGLIPVLLAAREGNPNLYRYSKDGGRTFTEWNTLTASAMEGLGRLTDKADLVLDYVTDPFRRPLMYRSAKKINSYDSPLSNVIYDKTSFRTFFDSNDPQVLGWAMNVLEKLFEPGIVPLYVSRDNQDDFNTYFFTITHFFAFIVIYARQFREFTDFSETSTISESSRELLLKQFIEGWGLVYENIDNDGQRKFLFQNWINGFKKRGTYQITETGGTIEGELRRLVGYRKPNEFIFGVLAPQDTGWCLGWSSPTWYGTYTVNAVSKGYDFGPKYAGDNFGDKIFFGKDEISIPTTGDEVKNPLSTEYPWEIFIGDDPNLPSDLLQAANIGVGPLSDYPILGDVTRRYQDDIYVLKPTGTGRCGISSEADLNKVMEVYVGLDYEVTVWVKADSEGLQNIEFGVNCYDDNMAFVKQVRITDFRETNSFFVGDRYQSPCKVPGIYYQLSGIIYNVKDQEDGDLYLNFENGRPLRFMDGVHYMAPYIVQNRVGTVTDISIAGITLKPLNLFQKGNDVPISQGFLGQKNIIAMYAQIKSARTKDDIEKFISRYLVSYKNVVFNTWLDWVVRTSWFLTFDVTNKTTGGKLGGAVASLSNGFARSTDEEGYVRFEIPFNEVIAWTVDYEGVQEKGTVKMDKDQKIAVQLLPPLFVDMRYDKTLGDVQITGQHWGKGWLPRTEVTFNAVPKEGCVFIKYIIVTDKTEDTRNPTNYFLGDHDIIVEAVFEKAGELSFSPSVVEIPASGGSSTVIASSNNKWVLDGLSDTWATVTPMQGDAGDTPIKIEIV